MKFKLTYILIFALSCKQNNLEVISNLKSNSVSEYIVTSESDSINENCVKEDSLFSSQLKEI